jgi:hypothetical protein
MSKFMLGPRGVAVVASRRRGHAARRLADKGRRVEHGGHSEHSQHSQHHTHIHPHLRGMYASLLSTSWVIATNVIMASLWKKTWYRLEHGTPLRPLHLPYRLYRSSSTILTLVRLSLSLSSHPPRLILALTPTRLRLRSLVRCSPQSLSLLAGST